MKKIFALISLSLIVFTSAATVYAAGPFDKATKNLNTAVGGLNLPTTVEGTVGTVIKGVLGLVGTIFFALTVYAGILWMTASGNEEKVEKAKSIIQAAVIGLFITMSAYAITTFVASKVGGASGGGGTSSPCETGGGTCMGAATDCPSGMAKQNLSCIDSSGAGGGLCCK